MAWIIRFILNVLVVLGTASVLGSGFPVSEPGRAAVFIIILTLLNWTLIPVLKFMTLPLNFLTLGLLGVLINGLGVVLTGTIMNISIGIIPAIIVALVLGVVNGIAEHSFNKI